MAQKKTIEVSPEMRRKSLEEDVAAFLAAGNSIEEVPSGLSAQDPQGRGKPLRLGTPKPEASATPDAAATSEQTPTPNDTQGSEEENTEVKKVPEE